MTTTPFVHPETSIPRWGLDSRLLKSLTNQRILTPTLIQEQVIPLVLSGRDVLVKSKTGSGKTLAYLIPLCHRIAASERFVVGGKEHSNTGGSTPTPTMTTTSGGVRALILVPTRELCDQVERLVKSLVRFCEGVTTVSLGDGSALVRRARLVEGPDVVVSTPGRVANEIEKSEWVFSKIETLVVDEADLCLSFGYKDDIEKIVDRVPRSCQCLLMSATLDEDVKALKSVVLNNAVVVKLNEGDDQNNTNVVTDKLAQWCVTVTSQEEKDLVVFALVKLDLLATGKTLFFVNTVDRGYRLKLLLEQFGVKCAVLNSELPANSRRDILDAFDKGKFDYLVATDEALLLSAPRHDHQQQQQPKKDDNNNEFSVARGVDFHNVVTVVNVDMPRDPDAYVHRVGRTARGQSSGTALSIVETGDMELLQRVRDVMPHLPDGQPQPVPLALDLAELGAFRYRVSDVTRQLAPKVVKEARMRDLRHELVNSKRLKSHFEENPDDLRLLKHDAPLRKHAVQRHLAHVPSYLDANAAGNIHAEARAGLAASDNNNNDEESPRLAHLTGKRARDKYTSKLKREKGGGGKRSKRAKRRDPLKKRR